MLVEPGGATYKCPGSYKSSSSGHKHNHMQHWHQMEYMIKCHSVADGQLVEFAVQRQNGKFTCPAPECLCVSEWGIYIIYGHARCCKLLQTWLLNEHGLRVGANPNAESVDEASSNTLNIAPKMSRASVNTSQLIAQEDSLLPKKKRRHSVKKQLVISDSESESKSSQQPRQRVHVKDSPQHSVQPEVKDADDYSAVSQQGFTSRQLQYIPQSTEMLPETPTATLKVPPVPLPAPAPAFQVEEKAQMQLNEQAKQTPLTQRTPSEHLLALVMIELRQGQPPIKMIEPRYQVPSMNELSSQQIHSYSYETVTAEVRDNGTLLQRNDEAAVSSRANFEPMRIELRDTPDAQKAAIIEQFRKMLPLKLYRAHDGNQYLTDYYLASLLSMKNQAAKLYCFFARDRDIASKLKQQRVQLREWTGEQIDPTTPHGTWMIPLELLYEDLLPFFCRNMDVDPLLLWQLD